MKRITCLFKDGLKQNCESFIKICVFRCQLYLSTTMYELLNRSALVQKLLTQVTKKQISQQQTQGVMDKIAEEISIGQLPITSLSENYDSYINLKIKDNAMKQIQQSSNYERDLRIMCNLEEQDYQMTPKPKPFRKKKVPREEQSSQPKKSDEEIKKEFMMKLRQWESQKQEILKRKQQMQLKKKSLDNSYEQKRKKEDEQVEAFTKLEKKKIIEARLRGIQERKIRRQEQLQESAIRRSQSLPKFKENENKYKLAEKQIELQHKILLKNRKLSLQMNLEQIKVHEKAYIDRIKQRLNIKSKSQNHSHINKSQQILSKSIDNNISIHKKSQEELKRIEQKIKRIKKFENKVRLMPLKIDLDKKREMQIKGDKLKNHKKYHFLSQKALSDEQIFDQFKDFDINIDAKDIGNQYFDEIKSNNQKGRRKVSSQKVLPVSKPEYKNYLAEAREKKQSILNPDQFDKMAKKVSKQKVKDKAEGAHFLLKKSQHYEQKVFQNIKQLKKINNYHDSIKKEEQIDGNYMKAIKAKLALAKIN